MAAPGLPPELRPQSGSGQRFVHRTLSASRHCGRPAKSSRLPLVAAGSHFFGAAAHPAAGKLGATFGLRSSAASESAPRGPGRTCQSPRERTQASDRLFLSRFSAGGRLRPSTLTLVVVSRRRKARWQASESLSRPVRDRSHEKIHLHACRSSGSLGNFSTGFSASAPRLHLTRLLFVAWSFLPADGARTCVDPFSRWLSSLPLLPFRAARTVNSQWAPRDAPRRRRREAHLEANFTALQPHDAAQQSHDAALRGHGK